MNDKTNKKRIVKYNGTKQRKKGEKVKVFLEFERRLMSSTRLWLKLNFNLV